MIEQMSGDFLQWIRGFYFVAECGSVTKAAALMGREQPTVTHQIKCLEREFGVTLFDRSTGSMKLTAEGRVLLEKSISLFEVIRGIKSELLQGQMEFQGKIAIAASYNVIDILLPPYVEKFRHAHPGVKFHMQGGFLETVLEKVESTEADFGISYMESVLPDNMVCHVLFETGMKLIAPRNNQFFSSRTPTLRQIAQVPLILFSRAGSPESFVEKTFNEAKLSPNVVMTHNNSMSIKKYVAQGIGAALISGYAVSDEDKKSLDIYPMDRYFPKRRYAILLRKKKYLPLAVKAFLRTIKPDITFAN
jgi:DNA-binding transcriptional LysR family regulator